MTVQPRERRVSISASPVDDGAEPSDWSNVPESIPEVTSDTRILSIDSCDRLVLVNAFVKSPPLILSKALDGKLVNELQLRHAILKLVPLDVSINGKSVNEVQFNHANLKLVPLEVSINGKLVNELQLRHAE